MNAKLRSARWVGIALAVLWLSAAVACIPEAARNAIRVKPPEIPAQVSAPERSWSPAAQSVPSSGAIPGTVVLSATGPWDLPSLVDHALSRNPRTRLSYAQSRAAAAAMGQANASFYP